MAGQPRKRAMIAELEQRAADLDGMSVLEYAEDWIGSGKTLAQLARDISQALGHKDDYITRNMVSKYLNGLVGGTEALATARKDEGSHALADSALDVVANPELTSKEGIAAAKNEAELRVKLAGFWNRAEYGQQAPGSVNVQVNMGQLHLDALRSRRVVQGHTAPALPSGEPDVEVVTDA